MDVRGAVGVGNEQPFPYESLAFPEQALAAFVHLRPEADVIQRAFELNFGLRALDEYEVAVARPADALVADCFARDLHVGGCGGDGGTELGRVGAFLWRLSTSPGGA